MNQVLQLTIRQRLPLFISLSALFILWLEGYFIYQYSVRFCEHEFRDRLQQRLTEADSLIAQDQEHPFDVIKDLSGEKLPDEKIFYGTDPLRIILPNGDGALSQLVDTAQFHSCNFCFSHVGQRDYGIKHDHTTHGTLVVSAVDRYGQSKMQNLKYGIIFGILIGVLLLTLASWFWVKRMLQPISDKIKKARNIGSKSLNLRLDVKNNYDELGQLALTFNEMLERIEKGFRSQQQFIRNASHEMRNPLTAITVEADLALQQSRTPDQYQNILENIRLKAENLNDLVAQLLLMAKVETNNQFSDQLTTAADEVLMSALRTIQVKYPDAHQHIRLQLEAADASMFLVRCDPTILKAAYYNLLDNAIKYGKKQKVNVRLFILDQYVSLQVADCGQGIEPEELPYLFEPFYRCKIHSNLAGSGIGLSLIKSIAEKYGGSIHIESKINLGTTALFKLPTQA